MAATPLVSIIVLNHNYGRFLPEAIESALGQTYADREVIVIDDGSTDDSVEVAARYGDAVRLITQPNQGLERTCNRAVREANGDYFAFLSADDVFEPTYVEVLLDALRRVPEASFAYCRAQRFGAESGPNKAFPFSVYHLVRRSNYVNGSALTNRADYLDAGGYSEDLADYALEDWDFWLKLIEHGKRGTFVREPLLRWRRHQRGSRNPETAERLARSVAFMRGRHSTLYRAVSDRRGTFAYFFDLAVAVADLVFGLSRWSRFVIVFESLSWRRYHRWHAPRLARDR